MEVGAHSDAHFQLVSRIRAQLERRARSMKSPTDLLFTRDGTFAGLRGRNLSPRCQWRQACLRKPFFAADFAKVISHVTAPHHQLVAAEREGSAGKVATRSKGEKSTPSA